MKLQRHLDHLSASGGRERKQVLDRERPIRGDPEAGLLHPGLVARVRAAPGMLMRSMPTEIHFPVEACPRAGKPSPGSMDPEGSSGLRIERLDAHPIDRGLEVEVEMMQGSPFADDRRIDFDFEEQTALLIHVDVHDPEVGDLSGREFEGHGEVLCLRERCEHQRAEHTE